MNDAGPPPVLAALQALEHSAVGEAVRNTPYLYPVLMALHVIGIALLLGPTLALDLRLLGAARTLVPVSVAARCLLPMARAGFALVAMTGALMFTAIARTVWDSAAAPWKFGLIALAGVNVLLFHRGPFRTVTRWDLGRDTPRVARIAAVTSALSWTSVVFAGRMLAY